MKIWIYILIIVVITILNQTLFRIVDLHGFVPNLLLMFVIFYSMSVQNLDFIFFAVVGGLWNEVLSGLPIGSISIGLVLIGTIICILVNKLLFKDRDLRYYFVAIVLSVSFLMFWGFMYVGLLNYFQLTQLNIVWADVWHFLPRVAAASLVLAFPIYFIADYALSKTQVRKANYLL